MPFDLNRENKCEEVVRQTELQKSTNITMIKNFKVSCFMDKQK